MMPSLLKKLPIIVSSVLLMCSCGTAPQYPQPMKVNAPCLVYKNSFCIAEAHPTKPIIASSSYDTVVKIWNQINGEVIQQLVHQDGVPAVEFSADGKFVVTGSYDSHVRLWASDSGELINTLKGHTQTVWGVTFSPDGKQVASVGSDDTVRLWNIETGQHQLLGSHDGDGWGIIFSPDGKLLLSSGEDNVIKVWQVSTGKLIRELDDHSGAVLNIQFSHDGKLLASGGDDYSIKLWDTNRWEVLKTLTGDFYSIYGLAFSPDDKMLVSGGRDKNLVGEILQYHFDYKSDENSVTMQLWNVANGELIQQFNGHQDDVNNVSFTHDGKTIISSGADGKVIFWNTTQLLNVK